MNNKNNITKTKIQLPLFEDKSILPTEKYHVSFSEYSQHHDCNYAHYLAQILKLSGFEGNIYTCYGKTIHDCIENFLKTKRMSSAEEAKKYFIELMTPLIEKMSPEEQEKEWEKVEEFSTHIKDTLEQFPAWVEETFPGWKLHSAEFKLFEKIDGRVNNHFKGFIDAVLMVPKKERKNSKKVVRLSDLNSSEPKKQEYEYWIIDHKTCLMWWLAEKRRDFKTQMQLILYKHYFSKKFNIPLKDIKLGFNLIRMNVPKNNKNRYQLFQVSAGEKTIEKALQELNKMIGLMKKNLYMKNRSNCRYCDFYLRECK